MKGVMISGLMDPNSHHSGVSVACATGSCTFADYGSGATHSSIRICRLCSDITDSVIVDYQSPNTFLHHPGPKSVTTTDNAYGCTMAVGSGSNLVFSKQRWLRTLGDAVDSSLNINILSLSQVNRARQRHLTAEGWNRGTIAASCMIYPCLRNYFAVVEAGVFSKKLVSTKPATLYTPRGYGETYYRSVEAEYLPTYTALRDPCPPSTAKPTRRRI